MRCDGLLYSSHSPRQRGVTDADRDRYTDLIFRNGAGRGADIFDRTPGVRQCRRDARSMHGPRNNAVMAQRIGWDARNVLWRDEAD